MPEFTFACTAGIVLPAVRARKFIQLQTLVVFPSAASVNTLNPLRLVDTQTAAITQLFAFSSNAFDGIEKLTALNLQVIKATLAENQALMAKALSSRPEELVALSASLAKPTAEKIAAYNRHVYEIMSGVQTALSATAPSQHQRYQRDAQEFAENIAKNASLGTSVVEAE
ncbi:phasin family protein [Paraburkholderia sp. BL17N1]|uniref:phasin family protein n=1 Tax=Paraburkholderia sp. BL17N1 TaxID=1938798 RepID=UPI00131522EE|nr:phasin family protein [Paraburkholderia sp. BL17N1]